MIIIDLLITILLIILAITDVNYYEVPLNALILGIIFGIATNIYLLLVGSMNIYWCFLSILPGLIMLLFNWFKPSQIGVGDGMALILSELFLPIQKSITALGVTTILSGIVSIFYLIRRKYSMRIPYILFIALGHIVVAGGWIG